MAHTSREDLLKKLEAAKKIIKIGSKYMHVKSGGEYIIENIVIREDNEEIRVIYKELNHEPRITWDRSYEGQDGFITPTEIDGKVTARFVKK